MNRQNYSNARPRRNQSRMYEIAKRRSPNAGYRSSPSRTNDQHHRSPTGRSTSSKPCSRATSITCASSIRSAWHLEELNPR